VNPICVFAVKTMEIFQKPGAWNKTVSAKQLEIPTDLGIRVSLRTVGQFMLRLTLRR